MIHTLPTRLTTLLCTTLLLLIFLLTLFLPTSLPSFSTTPTTSSPTPSPNIYFGPHPSKPEVNTRRYIHFLLPTTSTNPSACKTLFTSLALSYPSPILLGWGGHGRWNGSTSHLFKFPLLDEYFSRLGPEHDEDLVVLLDAFDVWLQLGPEVLIRRYLRAVGKENRRLHSKGILDVPAMGGGGRDGKEVKIRNTILFGADRLCWPQDPSRQIPCWSSPPSLLPPYIFGPATDTGDLEYTPTVRPRHLNSGTMIGTLKDVRDFWNATYDVVEELLPKTPEWGNRNSDQHYLHMVWNLQEEARLGVGNGTMRAGGDGTGERRREFGVTVDGEGDVFQESLYHEWVTWMRFNHSTSSSSSPRVEGSGEDEDAVNRAHAQHARLDLLSLPSLIASSPNPFSSDALISLLPSPDPLNWTNLLLGTNVLTGTVFPLFHITPQKWLRDIWWGRMWFHPFSEALLEAARRKWLRGLKKGNGGEQVVARVEGVEYVAFDGSRGDVEERARSQEEGKWRQGGVWSDLGVWMGWEEICGEFEGEVFLRG